jgi:hypothetical protein
MYFGIGIESVTVGSIPVASGDIVTNGTQFAVDLSAGYEISKVQNATADSGTTYTVNTSLTGDVVIIVKKTGTDVTEIPSTGGDGSKIDIVSLPNTGTAEFVVTNEINIEMDLAALKTTSATSINVRIFEIVAGTPGRYTVDIVDQGGDPIVNIPMHITLPCDPSKGEPRVTWVEGSESMRIVGVDTVNNTVTFATTHNSTYAITYYVAPTSPSGSVAVTFDPAGGTVSGAVSSVDVSDGTYGRLPVCIRDGYEFLGWYYGGTAVQSYSELVSGADHTLTARWNETSSPAPAVDYTVLLTAGAAAAVAVILGFFVMNFVKKN